MTHGCQNLLLSISEANECLTGVNMKQNQETQRKGKRQHLKTNTAVKTEKKMNQKPYNKCLINLVYSVCTGKYLPSVFRTVYENLREILSRTDLALG